MLPSVCAFYIVTDLCLPSNHAPVGMALSAEHLASLDVLLDNLENRAKELGNYDNYCMTPSISRKQIRWKDINKSQFRHLIARCDPLDINSYSNTDTAFSDLDKVLRVGLEQCRIAQPTVPGPQGGDKWSQLAQCNDLKELWNQINWNGSVKEGEINEKPSDGDFKEHFEKLLCPDTVEMMDPPSVDAPHVPILDNLFSLREMQEAINATKADKSGGPSGMPPGLLKVLTVPWLVFLVSLFNYIFQTVTYPAAWTASRLVVIFKKGSRSCCGNYRGIAIMDTFAKLFDLMLCRRLELWFRPEREQAGAQKGRGCVENIVGLRLLIDYAKHKSCQLFIVYVDFSKAYDKVPRHALIRLLVRLGCSCLLQYRLFIRIRINFFTVLNKSAEHLKCSAGADRHPRI